MPCVRDSAKVIQSGHTFSYTHIGMFTLIHTWPLCLLYSCIPGGSLSIRVQNRFSGIRRSETEGVGFSCLLQGTANLLYMFQLQSGGGTDPELSCNNNNTLHEVRKTCCTHVVMVSAPVWWEQTLS